LIGRTLVASCKSRAIDLGRLSVGVIVKVGGDCPFAVGITSVPLGPTGTITFRFDTWGERPGTAVLDRFARGEVEFIGRLTVWKAVSKSFIPQSQRGFSTFRLPFGSGVFCGSSVD